MTEPLTRSAASAAVASSGWRLLVGRMFAASLPVTSLSAALRAADAAASACGADADEHLRIDARPDRLELVMQTRSLGVVTARDAELVHGVTGALRELGLEVAPASGPDRPVQVLEIAIDALDIPAIRPFWRAVLGYADDPAEEGPDASIVDPAGQLPTIWFQQMDAPRPQRNRIHFDLSVPHDDAQRRVRRALDAGGTIVTDKYARAFWVLADAEGNEVCICTWQDRDQGAD